MQVLRLIAKLLFLTLVLLVILIFIGRYLLLSAGVSQIKDGVAKMRTAERNGLFVGECQQKGLESFDADQVVEYQLRFVDNKTFQVEAVCPGFAFDPMSIDSLNLPPLVQKQIKDSGLKWNGPDDSAITLLVMSDWQNWLNEHIKISIPLQVAKRVALVDKQLIYPELGESFPAGPVTSCRGYGYFCCDETAELGLGESALLTSDCQGQCFSRCATRPILLSFNTEPYMDTSQRTLQVNRGEEVTFNWVGDNLARAQLDFGDGQNHQFPADVTSAGHTYQCARAKCNYSVTITLFDAQNNASVVSALSSVRVEVF